MDAAELLEEGVFFGKRLCRRFTPQVMEAYGHDSEMPKARPTPEPAWRSIEENEPPLASESYDRRNGLGRHWGRAEPEVFAPTGQEKDAVPFAVFAGMALLVLLGREE